MMKVSQIALLFVFILTTCTRILHKEDMPVGKIGSYDQLLEAVSGVYGKLEMSLYDHGPEVNFYFPNIKGDDLTEDMVSDYGYYLYGHDHCYHQTPWSVNTGNRNELYSVIGSANNILVQYDLNSTSDLVTRQTLGEIYFIRAYCFFRLTRTYGEIPIIDNIDVSYSVSKSSFTKIYQFIESDLKTAIDLLPGNNDQARIPYVTPNRGSAKAMLAEVYLSWAGYPVKDASKYLLAAKEAGEVIDSATYYGIGLLENFAWLWDRNHLYNSESEFSLYCSNTFPDTNQTWNWHGFYYGLADRIPIGPDTWAGSGKFVSEIKFYNDFPPGYRKEITFYTTIYRKQLIQDSLGNVTGIDSGYVHIDTVNSCSRIAYRKFYYDPEYVNDKYDSYIFGIPRVYILRYAQTCLTYAEAAARSGNLNEKAYECVNEIRRRAHNLDIHSPSIFDLQSGLSPKIFADSVVWERAWELAGEPEGRWFDLVRLEKVEDLPKLRDPDEGGWPTSSVSKSDYFFRIPDNEIALNTNLGE